MATTTQDASATLRDELNARVSAIFESMWPFLHRSLTRLARTRWEHSALGSTPKRRWRLTTTLRLLEPPRPTEIDRALGLANACIHIEAQCGVRGAIESWTVTFRSYADHDEVQVIGAQVHLSHDITTHQLQAMLRAAKQEGPGRYELTAAPMSAAALRRHLKSAPAPTPPQPTY